MNTAFLLLAQYDGAAVIPLSAVCRDYFSHMTEFEFMRQSNEGKIAIPVVRMTTSQKSARGVHLLDLAKWIDERRAAAQKECDQLQGRR